MLGPRAHHIRVLALFNRGDGQLTLSGTTSQAPPRAIGYVNNMLFVDHGRNLEKDQYAADLLPDASYKSPSRNRILLFLLTDTVNMLCGMCGMNGWGNEQVRSLTDTSTFTAAKLRDCCLARLIPAAKGIIWTITAAEEWTVCWREFLHQTRHDSPCA